MTRTSPSPDGSENDMQLDGDTPVQEMKELKRITGNTAELALPNTDEDAGDSGRSNEGNEDGHSGMKAGESHSGSLNEDADGKTVGAAVDNRGGHAVDNQVVHAVDNQAENLNEDSGVNSDEGPTKNPDPKKGENQRDPDMTLTVATDEEQGHTDKPDQPQQGLASDSGLPSQPSNHPPNSFNEDGIGQSNLLKGLPGNRGERIVDQVHGTRRNKALLNDLFAKVGAQLEVIKYAQNGPDLIDRVNALEGPLNNFANSQEEYIKNLETALKLQQERCVELNEKMFKAENQCRDLEIQLNVTKKKTYETLSNRDMNDYLGERKEIMAELQLNREEIMRYEREIKSREEIFARHNEKNQKLFNDYRRESDNETMSLRQLNQALEKKLREVRSDSNYYNYLYQNEKAERKQSEDSFRREFQQMQQRVKEAEARAPELQRKNNLLKEEATRVLGDTTNLFVFRSEAKELAGGPSTCDPFAELEKENKVLRDQNAELEERLREAQNTESKKVSIETQLKSLKASFLHEFKNMQQSFKNVEAKTSELRNLLNNEVTNTNVRWGDDDENHSEQLVKDINKLQNSLKEFTQLKGRHIIPDKQGVNTLLQKYDCRLEPTKLIVSAALRRHVIEKVLEFTKTYFSKSIEDLDGTSKNHLEQYTKADLNYFLEALTLNATSSLEHFINEFAESREGEDELTRMIGVKICQQVYTVLGNRGFAANDHPFLVNRVKYVLNELDKYRQIKDELKRKDIEELAPIILEIIRIFYFRFRTQIPVVEYHFFKSGDTFDSATMECAQDDDGEGDKQVVEICSFPLVGVNIADKKKRQIFNKAKVQLRPSGSVGLLKRFY